MFYNVENLFDTKDDSLTNDNEFLPEGNRHWDTQKFYFKLNNIYKVIIAAGEWKPPILVGLCEIENQFVLNKLVFETPLNNFGYDIIHFESPDRRGIDVALLYREEFFTIDTAIQIPVMFPFDPDSRTRDILYVKGRFNSNDTVHLFINHWPSRYGGYLETIPKRNYVAGVLKVKTDSLFNRQPSATIIILGDFNDEPWNESLSGILQAKDDSAALEQGQLYNLSAICKLESDEGSLKYQGNWNLFDQVIVSGNLLSAGSGIKIPPPGFQIFSPGFLLEKDEKFLGAKPFRTYNGFKYNGGFSDHLPVFIDILLK
ncbi:MAG: hypothetical protein K8S16_09345 [Bacteroidales bacterium]|nr:hypothetical protein [Bacteroidales bacterium]